MVGHKILAFFKKNSGCNQNKNFGRHRKINKKILQLLLFCGISREQFRADDVVPFYIITLSSWVLLLILYSTQSQLKTFFREFRESLRNSANNFGVFNLQMTTMDS